MARRLGNAQHPNGWSMSTVFALFLLLSSIATINVFIVSFVWEKFAAMEADHIAMNHVSDGSSSHRDRLVSNSMNDQLFEPRKVHSEDWVKQSLACRWDDCMAAQKASQGSEAPWTEVDLQKCATGLVSLRTVVSANAGVVSEDSPCVTKDQYVVHTNNSRLCLRDVSLHLSSNPFVVFVDSNVPSASTIGILLDDFARLLAKEESFSAGLGANVKVVRDSSQDWDIRLTFHGTEGTGRIHIDDQHVLDKSHSCLELKRTISIHRNARAGLNALYGAVRQYIAEAIQQIRPPAPISLAVLIIWAGAKEPPLQLYAVAKSFVRSDPRVTAMIMVEEHAADDFVSFFDTEMNDIPVRDKNRVKVISEYDEESKGNLTKFIHSRADKLVPGIRNHFQYQLGWSLCDFRWLFGAIFEDFLPENQYTHWAWGDSDAFAGKFLESFSDYGYDLVRHDVISYGAIIIDRKGPASSMMAYTSGTLTIIQNTHKGRNLFRHTPSEKLERALFRSSNAILDEVGTSNAVLGAKDVSVALIHSQVRLAGTVYDRQSGRLFYISRDNNDATEMEKLKQLGRVNEAFSVAPLGFTTVLARFEGGNELPEQVPYVRDTTDDPHWYQPPKVNQSQFSNLLAPGSGFASLLRDSKGHWWHRPLHYATITRSRDRTSASLEEHRPIVAVEVAIVHSRLGGPCVIKPNSVSNLDYALVHRNMIEHVNMTASDVMDSKAVSSKQCSPFKHFFNMDK